MGSNKKFDLISLGRLAVDFYAEQVGSRLEDVQSFSKYLGGSSGNIAYGSSVQGLKVSMLARVGRDHLGRFLKEELERVGVDTSHIIFDDKRLTATVVLGIKNQATFPLLFYRNDCADMAISLNDFDEEYIASSKSLLITGTHFSTVSTKTVSMKAIEYARKHGVKVILDIDYRPTLWGLGAKDDGENRFVASEYVTRHLQEILPHCDLVVGTEEEFMIGGGSKDVAKALKRVREVSKATLVLKRGALGNSVFETEVPKNIDELNNESKVPVYRGVRVEVLNVLGAGDAFISGYLRGWLRDESPENCSKYANACGALVVSRHGCAPAIPTKEELDYYLEHADKILKPDKDVFLNHLHKVTKRSRRWDNLSILAFDHRIQFEELFELYNEKLGKDEQSRKITCFKELVFKAFEEVVEEQKLEGKSGFLADGRYGQEILNQGTGKGYWMARPVEKPNTTPLMFDQGFAIGNEIISWPQEQIIKCLVFCDVDDPEGKAMKEQEAKVLTLYEAALKTGNELLLEVIPQLSEGRSIGDYVGVLPKLMKRFYTLGVKPDWWKLFPQNEVEWQTITKLVDEEDKYCRGVLLLGLNASLEVLANQFALARQFPICKGFAVGRSIFQEPCVEWLKGESDIETVKQIKANYTTLVGLWYK